MKRFRCLVLTATLLTATLWFAAPAEAQPAAPMPDSSFSRWAHANAIPLGSVDQPYADSSFEFLRPLVGTSRILEVGELIHGGHEPLAFRNAVIKYAVTRMGFTAVALESGLTDATLVDTFIRGGAGNIDSVLRAGLTYGFGSLPENRELILWLREHNAHATRKVSCYGVDLTGGDDYNGGFPGAPLSVLAALDYLRLVAPTIGADLSARLLPLMNRFNPPRYGEFSPPDRHELRTGLDRLYQALLVDSSRAVRATSPRRYAQALRNAWMAARLNDIMGPPTDSTSFNTARAGLRDSVMAENAKWALSQEGDQGRLVFFAHNGHIMNALSDFRSANTTYRGIGGWKMTGRHLREWFGHDVFIIASTAPTTNVRRYWTNGTPGNPLDATSFDAALARIGEPAFVLDLRSADRIPDVANTLRRSWPFRIQTFFQQVVPREAADAIVYFDRVTPSKDNLRNVDPQLMRYTDDRSTAPAR
jgi:erythromycin esterase